jgi:hypothetical protein
VRERKRMRERVCVCDVVCVCVRERERLVAIKVSQINYKMHAAKEGLSQKVSSGKPRRNSWKLFGRSSL